MANKRIKDLTQTATTLASDDYVAIDGSSNGTRKIVKGDLVNDISSQVAGTYLDEANNLSDVASLDTSKLNLEVPDVGTAPNEVPLNGMLGDMAYQSSDGVSMVNAEVETLEVTDNLGVIPTGTDINPGIVSKVGAFLSSNSEVGIGFSGFPSGDGASKSAIIHERKDTYGRGDLHICSNYDADATNANKSDAVITVDGSTGSVGIGTGVPPQKLTVQGGGVQIAGAISSPASGVSALLLDWVSSNSRYWSRGVDATTQGKHNFYVLENDGGNQVNALEINASGLKFPVSGLGIDFGSGASTTLDDYEEGYHTVTATPTTSGSVTLSTGANTFTYTKIGNIVSVSGTVIVSSVSSPVGGLWLSLPVGSVTLTSSAGLVGGSVYYQDSGTGNFVKPFRIQANSLIEILMDASTLAANDRFGLNVTYRTTAS